MKTKRGYITITLAMAIGISVIGGITTFYKVIGSTDREIGLTNERVSVVETQVSSILSGQTRMEQDIKTITNYLMGQKL